MPDLNIYDPQDLEQPFTWMTAVDQLTDPSARDFFYSLPPVTAVEKSCIPVSLEELP